MKALKLICYRPYNTAEKKLFMSDLGSVGLQLVANSDESAMIGIVDYRSRAGIALIALKVYIT